MNSFIDSTAQFVHRIYVTALGPRQNGFTRPSGRRGILGPLFSIPTALICIWILTIWWGEHLVYKRSIKACDWSHWEEWPSEAIPHHVVFIADPQLVDPHTYPGRPWPLSSLTVFYTDLYLRRSYSLLQRVLHPDTVFFLGDLFDGGREWGTAKSHSPDKRYKSYGNNVWMKEYERFGQIFFSHWTGDSEPNYGQRGRRIIAELPGNHDLGLGKLIQGPVRTRFNSYFGEGNRIDIVGNHSIVSVDTVSLTAMDQADPSTGSQGTDDTGGNRTTNIWEPVESFLDDAKATKARAFDRELRYLYGKSKNHLYTRALFELDSVPESETPPVASHVDVPTILLSHIPLYRKPGTPCGPLRERWPPTHTGRIPDLVDERNAIPYYAGYQYQNVLTPAVSKDLITKIGNVVQIYSGDDHDYCEIDHREYSGKIKEITVKSMSWAMGIRRPGFELTSLWNPIDENGNHMSYPGSTSSPTIQNKLCLLPDQLSIFIQYGILLGFTLAILLIRSIVLALRPEASHGYSQTEPVLPTSVPGILSSNAAPYHSSAEQEKSQLSKDASSSRPLPTRYHRSPRGPSPLNFNPNLNDSSRSSASETRLPPRSTAAASRTSHSSSPTKGYAIPITNGGNGNFGPASYAHVVGKEAEFGASGDDWDEWGMPRKRKPRGFWARVLEGFTRSVSTVGVVSFGWYLWMLLWM